MATLVGMGLLPFGLPQLLISAALFMCLRATDCTQLRFRARHTTALGLLPC